MDFHELMSVVPGTLKKGISLVNFITLFLLVILLGTGCNPAFWDAMAATSGSSFSSAGHKCPSCHSSMYFTGDTKIEWGKLLKMYCCSSGHKYWYPSTSSSRSPYVKNPCPICGMGTYFTGETRIEWGKLQKIYKCPVGHLSVK